MIFNYKTFQNINEGKYETLKQKYHSLGEYVEHLKEIIEDKEKFSSILGKYLKIPTKKYDSKRFEENDIVLIEYWYKDIITPVRILEKSGRKYLISHNVDGSSLKNAPDETIKKDRIIDHFKENNNNKKEKNIDPSIRISRAVNLLNPYDQMLLVKNLHDEFGIEENNSFELEEIKDVTLLKQIGFNSFMKIVSALNLPKIDSDLDNCPRDFYLIYITENLNKERLLSIMNRFKSMNSILKVIKDSTTPIKLYFGLKYNNGILMEYGLILNNKRHAIGEFKLNKKNWNILINKNSKPLINLQKQIEHTDLNGLKKLMKIKQDLSNFSPGYYHEKTNSNIENNTVMQGYLGTGSWSNGVPTTKSFNEIKEKFKTWILKQKWAKDILFNVSASKMYFWVKIQLKKS